MWMKRRVMAPGPTPVPESGRLAMAETPGYHRTPEFSRRLREVTRGLQRVMNVDWPVLTLAASGTGGMEAAVQNLVRTNGTALVVEAGKFGERWSTLLSNRGARVVSHTVEWGRTFDVERLLEDLGDHEEVSAVFATLVETSTLVRHPIHELGEALPDDVLLVVDAISGLGAEPFEPSEHGVNAVVGGSQKALMAPPGLAFLAVDTRAQDRARQVKPPGTYFDLARAIDRLSDGFQTPWTPSLPLIQSLQDSLERLFEEGKKAVQRRHHVLSRLCRRGIRSLGLESFAERPTVVGTAVRIPDSIDSEALRSRLSERYGVFVPGGQKRLAGRILRIGHLGHVDYFDLLAVLAAIELALREEGWETRGGLGAVQDALIEVTSSGGFPEPG